MVNEDPSAEGGLLPSVIITKTKRDPVAERRRAKVKRLSSSL